MMDTQFLEITNNNGKSMVVNLANVTHISEGTGGFVVLHLIGGKEIYTNEAYADFVDRLIG